MEIHWNCATRYHDWFGASLAVPKMMINQFYDAGLIGKLEWVELGIHNKRATVDSAAQMLTDFLDFKPKRNDLYRVAAGGHEPFKWKLTIGLFPFDKSLKMVKGYNIFNLWFEKQAFSIPSQSESLFTLFKKVNLIQNTEFAFIHPYHRWIELIDPFYGYYKEPVTFIPMFSGVPWAAFFGPDHLKYFDLSKLKEIEAYQIEWVNSSGLYIRVSPNIADAVTEPVEKKMIQLTEFFRKTYTTTGD